MKKDRPDVRGRAAMWILAAALLTLLFPAAASATVYAVNTTEDLPASGECLQPPAGECSIRDALGVATGSDSVTLPAGIYELDPTLGPLMLVGDRLNGAGARTTIIDGLDGTRVMDTDIETGPTLIVPQVSGVTIRGGNGENPVNASDNNGDGGGIFVEQGLLGLVNSQIVGNSAAGSGGGIATQSGADVTLVGSTVSGNVTEGDGGGIWNANEGTISATNSTISGNNAVARGGGLSGGGGSGAVLLNATVAGNQADTVGGVNTDSTTFRNTIIAGNAGAQCLAPSVTPTSNNTLVSDNSCALAGTGDIQGVNPGLGALANNGGPTDTRAIGPTSRALNHGGANCQTADQRGVARPQLGTCDIGAFEYRQPHLTVVTRVVNDQSGTQTAADFTVHVRAGAGDVAGSPKPGSATGTTYALAPGGYVVAEDADSRYTTSFSGACGPGGSVGLNEGTNATCTVTNNDKPPVVGKIINAEPAGGTVRVQLKGKGKFHVLREGEQLPNGTVVDTRKGRIGLTAAANKAGALAKADFFDGLFKLTQSKGKTPITTLTLVEKLSCKSSAKKAQAAKKKKRKRRLWGDGHGKFRTKGSFSSATVRGTKWLVQDTCTTTLTRVKRGKVEVRDFVKHKTVFVKAGHRYLAHKRR